METVLTAPVTSETQIDSLPTRQSAKRTRSKRKSILSSNGNHPSKAFIISGVKKDVKSHSWESEGWRYIETTSENGLVKQERVSLTPYELLHPQEGYIIVHKTPHDRVRSQKVAM